MSCADRVECPAYPLEAENDETDIGACRAPELNVPVPHDFKLTRKESCVLRLILRGLQNKHIAERMCITESTVKSHVSRILRKTGTNNRTEAALLYVRKSDGFFDRETG